MLGPTKTLRSRPTVPLPEVCTKALRIHRARQTRERLAAGSMWQEHGLVFTSVVGTPLEPRNVNRSFDTLARRAEVGGRWVEEAGGRVWVRQLRLHDLRHTCATLLLAQGVHARVVMEILGHSQIGVTMNTYTHVPSDLMRSAAAGLSGLLDVSAGGGLSSNAVVNDPENGFSRPGKGG